MFNKRIVSFFDYLKESLSMTYWRNCVDDTNVGWNKEANDIANALVAMFEVQNPKELMFTSNDAGLGTDYAFMLDIVRPLTAIENKTLQLPGYIVYINMYEDDKSGKKIALVHTHPNDGEDRSDVYIKCEDFKDFDPSANEDPGVDDPKNSSSESAQGGSEGMEGGEEMPDMEAPQA